MTLSLATLAIGFMFLPKTAPGAEHHATWLSIVVVIAIATYIAGFAASLGPLAWTMIAEIFPNKVRGKGVSIASGSNWIANLLVAVTTLWMFKDVSAWGTFLIFTALSLFTFFWILVVVPETKGYTLEEIEANLARGGRKKWLPPSGDGPSVD